MKSKAGTITWEREDGGEERVSKVDERGKNGE
jgi:hypothetical protein